MKLVKSAVLALGLLLIAQGAVFAQATPSSVKEQAELDYAKQPHNAFSDLRGIGVGLVIIGAALGIGGLAKSAVESMARQPETAGNVQTAMIIAAALIEGVTFFALIVIMLFIVPPGDGGSNWRSAATQGPPVHASSRSFTLPMVDFTGSRGPAPMPRLPILVLGLLTLSACSPRHARPVRPWPPSRRTGRSVYPRARRRTGREHGRPRFHSEPGILDPQPSLALWTVVVFVGLLFVLGKFAWKPLLQALHLREEHLEHVLMETERARNESEQLLAEHRKLMNEAADQVRALLDAARREAQTTAEDILQKARAEADAERQRAKRDIENARDQALSEIWQKTADLAVSVAGRVLSKELGPDDHRRLVAFAARHELPDQPVAPGQGSLSA